MEGTGLRGPLAPPLRTNEWWMQVCPLVTVAALLSFILNLSGAIPRYRPGEVATNEVIAPFEFAVVNHEQTERLRREEVAKVPAVFRCDPWVAVQAEEKLIAAFGTTRSAFLQAMETAARKRVLDEATVAHPSFWRFVEWFQKQQPGFPLPTNLVTAWALGRDDMELQLRTALREAMSRSIRADVVAASADTPFVQVLVTEHPDARMTLDDLRVRAQVFPASDILKLSEARKQLTLTNGLEAFSGFVGSFLRENLVFEEWLTTLKRQTRSAELVVFDQYSAGQMVVQAGQIIDGKAAAALDVLAAAVARNEARMPVTTPVPPVLAPPLRTTLESLRDSGSRHLWLASLFAGLLVVVFWRLIATRSAAPANSMEGYTKERAFLPARTEESRDAETRVVTRGEWRAQLREAEHRAEELLALVRAGLAPHLAKELTHKLVQELMSQRATLLRAHQLAERDINALEARFEKVYGELRERIGTYEMRTLELEKELTAKAEQTRELMKATILLTQQKLEHKKTGDEYACN
jgi:hypothetical protein